MVQAEDRAKVRKQQADAAIKLALDGRWDDAADLNRSILEQFPTDVDACNRLGKALTELGRYGDAKDAYQKALEADPVNAIARKNLERLASLGGKAKRRPAAQKISPQMFIEETGKTGVTVLVRPNMEVAVRMSAGDQVELARDNGSLVVKNLQGELLGAVEPRLAQRLSKLMEGGNQYVAAISGLADDDVRVFLRETYQDPSQAGKLSFPPHVTEAFRPYVKERLVRKDADDESYYDPEDSDDWAPGQEAGPRGGGVAIGQFSGGDGDEVEDQTDDVDEDEE
jgi:tetratricopeptide (TPR) repeat protein